MLFIENPYLKEFESKVQKVENNNIVLEQTAFYAKSGGQPGDVGKIKLNEKEISVIDTMYDQEKNIIHVCDNSNDLNIGEIIKGKINWEIRYKHMRMHSALHLLCSLIPYDVTGGQISFEKSRLDFNAEDKIESVPLINLEELSPTFEEDKTELEKMEDKNIILDESDNISSDSKSVKNDKVYINLTTLDKITAKTSSIKLAIGDKKFFGSLEIQALKCQLSESSGTSDAVAYIQVKDLSAKDNNQVFLFNGWTFASSPTLQSIDHPIYDLWITSCENI